MPNPDWKLLSVTEHRDAGAARHDADFGDGIDAGERTTPQPHETREVESREFLGPLSI